MGGLVLWLMCCACGKERCGEVGMGDVTLLFLVLFPVLSPSYPFLHAANSAVSVFTCACSIFSAAFTCASWRRSHNRAVTVQRHTHVPILIPRTSLVIRCCSC